MRRLQRFLRSLSIQTKILVLFLLFIATALSTYIITKVYFERLEKDQLAATITASVSHQPEVIVTLAQRTIETNSDRTKQQLEQAVLKYNNVIETIDHGGQLEDRDAKFPEVPDAIAPHVDQVKALWYPFMESAQDIVGQQLYRNVKVDPSADESETTTADPFATTSDQNTDESDPFADFDGGSNTGNTDDPFADLAEDESEETSEDPFADLADEGSDNMEDPFADLAEEETNGASEDPFADLKEGNTEGEEDPFAAMEEEEETTTEDPFAALEEEEGNSTDDPFADLADEGNGSNEDPFAEMNQGDNAGNTSDPFAELEEGSTTSTKESEPFADGDGEETTTMNMETGSMDEENMMNGISFFSEAEGQTKKVLVEDIQQAQAFLKNNVADLSAVSQDLVQAYLDYIKDQKRELDIILLSLLAFNILILVFGYFMVRNAFINPIAKLSWASEKILKGHAVELPEYNKNELGTVYSAMNYLLIQLSDAAEFVRQVAKGNLDVQFKNVDEDKVNSNSLQGVLLALRNHLKKLDKEEEQRSWASEGLSKFVDILRMDSDDMQVFCQRIISNLVEYMGANQGGMFLVEEDEAEEHTYLELVAAYAYGRDKYIHKKVELGEGLVGQCFYEKKTIYMTDVPQGYVDIKSGLGDATPEAILIVPLLLNEELQGVIEIASFRSFEQYEIDFVKRLAENIAGTVSSAKVNSRTKQLLERSQELTEQMRAQEEEMRQNMEEMEATQEEMNRKETELRKMYEEAKENEEELKLQKKAMEKNISEMSMVQAEMREKDAKFAELTASIPGILYQYTHFKNGDHGYTYMSGSVKNILGYTAKAITNSEVKIEVHEEDIDMFEQMLAETKKEVQPRNWTGRVKKADGSYAYVHLVSNPTKKDNGDIVWSGYMEDVNERVALEQDMRKSQRNLEKKEKELRENLEQMKKAQEESEEKQALLNGILDSTSLGVVRITEEGKISGLNKTFTQMTQADKEEDLMGFAFEDFFKQEEMVPMADKLSAELGIAVPPSFEVFVAPCKNKGESTTNQWTLKTKEGKDLPIKMSVQGIKTESGEFKGFLAEITDLSKKEMDDAAVAKAKEKERQAAEKELEQQKKLVNKVVAKFEKREEELLKELKEAQKDQSEGAGHRDAEIRMLKNNNEAQKEMYEKRIQELEEEIKKLRK